MTKVYILFNSLIGASMFLIFRRKPKYGAAEHLSSTEPRLRNPYIKQTYLNDTILSNLSVLGYIVKCLIPVTLKKKKV